MDNKTHVERTNSGYSLMYGSSPVEILGTDSPYFPNLTSLETALANHGMTLDQGGYPIPANLG